MLIVTKHEKHKGLLNDENEPYEFELKPVNGRMIRAFHICYHCGALFDPSNAGECAAAPALKRASV